MLIKRGITLSRGEENIFVWSFFLAIAGLAIDNDENYKWVKTIYIDDPISSLDDNNVITVASLKFIVFAIFR
jgi:wobble nucleotide-excising tRNase